jgi:hypothetical protein
MRSLRTFIGLLLVVFGLPMAVIAVAGLRGLQHQDASGAFSSELAPVATAGYVVVVPDVAGLLDRHGATRLMGNGQLRLTLGHSEVPLVLAVGPAAEVEEFTRGIARTEVTRVGFAVGPQPVQSTDIAGASLVAGLPQRAGWRTALAGQTLDLSQPTDPGIALVVLRTDQQAGFAPVLAVAFTPGWLSPAVWGLLLAGTVALVAGVALALWPVRRQEVLVVVEEHRMVDLADRIARKLGRDVDIKHGRHRGAAPLLNPPVSASDPDDQDRTGSTWLIRPSWYDVSHQSSAAAPMPREEDGRGLRRPTAGHTPEPNGESPYVFTAT